MHSRDCSTSLGMTRSLSPVKISALGDSALLIDFADESASPDVLLHRALSAADALELAKIPGVREITSAYQSVALFLDLRGINSSMEENIRAMISATEMQST